MLVALLTNVLLAFYSYTYYCRNGLGNTTRGERRHSEKSDQNTAVMSFLNNNQRSQDHYKQQDLAMNATATEGFLQYTNMQSMNLALTNLRENYKM